MDHRTNVKYETTKLLEENIFEFWFDDEFLSVFYIKLRTSPSILNFMKVLIVN